MAEENKLALVLEDKKLEIGEVQDELKIFTPFFDQVEKMKKACMSIVITDVSQMDKMQEAREKRLIVQKIRTSGEKEKDKGKKIPLRKCQAYDALFRYLREETQGIEDHLLKQEKFVEDAQNEAKDKLEAKRKEELDKYRGKYEFVDLREMPEDNYQNFLSDAKKTHMLEEAEAEAFEDARIEQEKKDQEERDRVQKENDELKAAADKKEKDDEKQRLVDKAAQDKIDAVNKKKLDDANTIADQAKKELDDKNAEDARIKKADDDRIEAEQKKKDKEEKEALLAPDKVKLQKLAVQVTELVMPDVKSKEAKEIVLGCVELLNRTSNYIKEKTINL